MISRITLLHWLTSKHLNKVTINNANGKGLEFFDKKDRLIGETAVEGAILKANFTKTLLS